jgi:hypothetical protein
LSGASTVAFFDASFKRSDTGSMSRVRLLNMPMVCVFPITSEMITPVDTVSSGGDMMPSKGLLLPRGDCSLSAWNAFRIESKGRDCADAASTKQMVAVEYAKRCVGFIVLGRRGSRIV